MVDEVVVVVDVAVSEGVVTEAVLPEGIDVSVDGAAAVVVDGVVVVDVVSLDVAVVAGVITVVVVVEPGVALAPELL